MNHCSEAKALLTAAVNDDFTESILYSGGLDTSILAWITSQHSKPTGYTIHLEGGEDIPFASMLAAKLKMRHIVNYPSNAEMLDAIEQAIKICKTFDPSEARHNAVVYLGLKLAKENGCESIMTGDAADELFWGYSLFFDIPEEKRQEYFSRWVKIAKYPSTLIGAHLGVEVKTPYLNLIRFSLALPSDMKINSHEGVRYGKWVFRKAFEQDLPGEIIWRQKAPLEKGSGAQNFAKVMNAMIQTADFEKEKKLHAKEGVIIDSKEKLLCYRLFLKHHKKPAQKNDEKPCNLCSYPIKQYATHCSYCGNYPVTTLA